jgi:cobalamin synthase
VLGYLTQSGVNYLVLLIAVATFVLKVWALIDAATRRPDAYVAAGKQTKKLWIAILAVAVVVQLAIASPLFLLNLIGIAAAIVYLVDVRPALRQIGGGRGGGGGGGYGW